MKKLLCVLTALALMFSLVGCGNGAELPQKTAVTLPETGKELRLRAEEKTVAQNDRLALSVCKYGIAVTDQKCGKIWRSFVAEDVYDVDSLNRLWKAAVRSMLKISYCTGLQSVQVQSVSATEAGADVTAKTVENGLCLTYDFDELGICLSVYVTLDGDALVCSVPAAEIRETKRSILTSVEWMPFFGASSNEQQGFFLCPDGSGAVMHFGKNTTGGGKTYSWLLYGDSASRLSSAAYTLPDTGAFYLPVYGVSHGDSGFVSVATVGSEDTKLNLYTGAMAVRLNRLAWEFVYRRTYDMTVNSLDGDGEENVSTYTNIAENLIATDHEVRYIFLDGAADVDRMAQTARDWLCESGVLKDRTAQSENLPLAVDFMVGTMDNELVSSYVSLTDFDQCGEILEQLSEKGVKQMKTALFGWNRDGYGTNPASYSADARAGGKSGLKNLIRTAKNCNTELFLGVNYVDINADGKRYSTRKDCIRNQSFAIVSDRLSQNFLLVPTTAREWFESDAKKMPEGIAGVVFDGFGETLFNHYKNNLAVERETTAKIWQQMAEQSNSRFGQSAAVGGNAFLLNSVSRLYGIPESDSGFAVFDETVPFFQMVVHGFVDYTGTPVNLFYDQKAQVLKMVEYGFLPYYEWTYCKSSEQKGTPCDFLYSSWYASFADPAAELYRRLNGDYAETYNARMTAHTCLQEGVFATDYDNGCRVIVNYNGAPVTVDGHTVAAQDYSVVKEKNR